AVVVALDEATTGRVVVIRGERKTGVIGELEDSLAQSFAESSLANELRAVVILQRAGYDLRRRCSVVVHENDDREFGSAVAVGYAIDLFRVRAAPLGDDQHAALEQLIR